MADETSPPTKKRTLHFRTLKDYLAWNRGEKYAEKGRLSAHPEYVEINGSPYKPVHVPPGTTTTRRGRKVPRRRYNRSMADRGDYL